METKNDAIELHLHEDREASDHECKHFSDRRKTEARDDA